MGETAKGKGGLDHGMGENGGGEEAPLGSSRLRGMRAYGQVGSAASLLSEVCLVAHWMNLSYIWWLPTL